MPDVLALAFKAIYGPSLRTNPTVQRHAGCYCLAGSRLGCTSGTNWTMARLARTASSWVWQGRGFLRCHRWCNTDEQQGQNTEKLWTMDFVHALTGQRMLTINKKRSLHYLFQVHHDHGQSIFWKRARRFPGCLKYIVRLSNEPMGVFRAFHLCPRRGCTSHLVPKPPWKIHHLKAMSSPIIKLRLEALEQAAFLRPQEPKVTMHLVGTEVLFFGVECSCSL